MSAPSSAEPRAANLESLWTQHKNELHRLYITENQTLSQVKDSMEAVHKFPVLRLHDYEVALRDLLKLKKNLKKEDWYSIGIQISNRKRQGKDSEVWWNNVPMSSKKVRKDVLRNRKLNRLCYRSRPVELPVGLIIRTPPCSPPAQLAIIERRPGLQVGPDQVTSSLPPGFTGEYPANSTTWEIETVRPTPAQVGTSRFRHLRQNLPFSRFMLALQELVNSHPLLINMPAEWTYVPGPRMFGGNPSLDVLTRAIFTLSNKLSMDWRSEENSWFLNWLGVSAEFAILRTFFSIKTPTVCAAYETLCDTAKDLRRSPVARVLFQIQDTVRKNCPMTADGVDFLEIAVEIGSGADGMLDIAERASQSSSSSCKGSHFKRGPYSLALFLLAAARRDIPMMKVLIRAFGDSHDKAQIPYLDLEEDIFLVMHQVFAWDPEEIKDSFTIRDYFQLLKEGGILSTSPPVSCCYQDRHKLEVTNFLSFTIDELVMLCPPVKRRKLYCAILRCNSEHAGFLSRAGIFTAALEGAQNLLDYIHCCKQNNAFDVHVAMQECLVFAAFLNDTQTASALVQLGVDPEVSLLSANQVPDIYHRGDISWNPMVIAAAERSLETLELLSETGDLNLFLRTAPFYQICHRDGTSLWDPYMNAMSTELCRLQSIRFHLGETRLASIIIDRNGRRHPWPIHGDQEICQLESTLSRTDTWFSEAGTRGIETITWIRAIAAAHGAGARIDKEIIKAALFDDRSLRCTDASYHPCDVLLLDGLVDSNLDYHEGGMDLLQLSIRAQCNLDVVEFLLSKGLRVHSRAAAQSGNTMLHDALLGRSRDRSKIVRLLLREGADLKHPGDGLTVLEASLQWDFDPWDLEFPSDYLDIFAHLLDTGAPVKQKQQPRPKKLKPLIDQLVRACAEDDLILRVVDAGADLNERGDEHEQETPLVKAIAHGREKLARELIVRGADVHAPADHLGGCTALQAACRYCSSFQFVEYLVKVQRANVNEAPIEFFGWTALQQAAVTGSMALVEFLLDHGADVNALSGREPEGRRFPEVYRALDFAAVYGRLDMVEFLLKAGGRSSTRGLGGAIVLAKNHDHFAVVSVLLDWEKQHGRRLVEEEVEWQRRHPDAARLLSKCRSYDDFSDGSDSQVSGEEEP